MSQTLTMTVRFLMTVSVSIVTVSSMFALVVVSSVTVSMTQAAVKQRVAVTVT